MTGEALGKRIEPPVSKQMVAHWEKGRYPPNIRQLVCLCNALQISADALLLGVKGPLSESAMFLGMRLDRIEDQDIKATAMAEAITVIQSHFRQSRGGWPTDDEPSGQRPAQIQ